jgi:hypothetical protein
LNSLGPGTCLSGVRLCLDRRLVREAEGSGVGGSTGAGVRKFKPFRWRGAGVREDRLLIDGSWDNDFEGGKPVLEDPG